MVFLFLGDQRSDDRPAKNSIHGPLFVDHLHAKSEPTALVASEFHFMLLVGVQVY